MECPRCGSPELFRKGTRAGKQKYKCKNCKASFTEGVPYKPALKRPPLEKECPKCHSTHVIRDGEGRYKCRTCRTRFTDNVNPARFTEKRWNCPYCGKPLIKTGTGRHGQVKYHCNNCGKTCSGDLETKEPIFHRPFKELNKTIRCPECSSLKIKKAGISKGKERFKCLKCGRVFHENSKSKKQRDKLIVLYGVHLGLPTAQLSTYLHCSKKYCREFIKRYRERSMSPSTSLTAAPNN